MNSKLFKKLFCDTFYLFTGFFEFSDIKFILSARNLIINLHHFYFAGNKESVRL